MKNSPHRIKHEQRKAIRQAQKGWEENKKACASSLNKQPCSCSDSDSILDQKKACWTKIFRKKTLATTKYLQKGLQRFKFFKKGVYR